MTASNPLNHHKNPSKAQLSHNAVDTHSESLQQRAKKSSSHSLDDNIPSGSSTNTTTTAATDVLITETSSTRNKSNRKISSSKKPNYRNVSPEIVSFFLAFYFLLTSDGNCELCSSSV